MGLNVESCIRGEDLDQFRRMDRWTADPDGQIDGKTAVQGGSVNIRESAKLKPLNSQKFCQSTDIKPRWSGDRQVSGTRAMVGLGVCPFMGSRWQCYTASSVWCVP